MNPEFADQTCLRRTVDGLQSHHEVKRRGGGFDRQLLKAGGDYLFRRHPTRVPDTLIPTSSVRQMPQSHIDFNAKVNPVKVPRRDGLA